MLKESRISPFEEIKEANCVKREDDRCNKILIWTLLYSAINWINYLF